MRPGTDCLGKLTFRGPAVEEQRRRRKLNLERQGKSVMRGRVVYFVESYCGGDLTLTLRICP